MAFTVYILPALATDKNFNKILDKIKNIWKLPMENRKFVQVCAEAVNLEEVTDYETIYNEDGTPKLDADGNTVTKAITEHSPMADDKGNPLKPVFVIHPEVPLTEQQIIDSKMTIGEGLSANFVVENIPFASLVVSDGGTLTQAQIDTLVSELKNPI